MSTLARSETVKSRLWRRLGRWVKRGVVFGAVLIIAAWIGLKFVPVPEALLRRATESLEFVDRNGETLREARVEERFRREAGEIPQIVIRAAMAAEDKRFYSHSGVDWLAAGRAAWSSVRAGRKTSGASTITQQLIKLSVPRERTWGTKFVEMATALRLEQLWTKQEILAAYLNRLDFGNVNYGVVVAANYYFGKPLSDLSDAEAALLMGLPLNPSRLNPHTNMAGAKRRQETVLRRMRENDWLSAEQFERAMAEPIHIQTARRIFHAPHFVELVMSEVAGRKQEGVVRTTLDLDLNRVIERSVAERLAKLRGQNVRDAAVVVLDNRTGGVLGLVGSGDYFAPGSGQVNGATQPRSAGSTIKPVTYLLAMERGDTAATIVADVPTEFPTATGPYRPENFHRHCEGPVRYREALACSLNIPAVRVLQSLGGAAPLHRRLQAWGVTTLPRAPEEYGLGLTIGNAEVRLVELTNVYATLARMGRWLPVRLRADDELRMSNRAERDSLPQAARRGAAEAASNDARGPAVPRELCWIVADILADNAARSGAFGANSALRFDFPVACKTGTSTDFRDNWAMGFTPEFTVGVWVGNFDGTPMREVSGVSGAGPILHDVMIDLHKRFGTTWFERPAGIVEREVHPLTGKLLAAPRADSVREKFLETQLPAMESAGDYDAQGRVKLGAEFAEWAASADNQIGTRVAVAGSGGLHLVSPTPGSTFVIDPDVPSSSLVPLVVSGTGDLVWKSPTLMVREVGGKFFAEAVEGEHRLTVLDVATGKTLETWIRVKAL